jgi:hypothetical protein
LYFLSLDIYPAQAYILGIAQFNNTTRRSAVAISLIDHHLTKNITEEKKPFAFYDSIYLSRIKINA